MTKLMWATTIGGAKAVYLRGFSGRSSLQQWSREQQLHVKVSTAPCTPDPGSGKDSTTKGNFHCTNFQLLLWRKNGFICGFLSLLKLLTYTILLQALLTWMILKGVGFALYFNDKGRGRRALLKDFKQESNMTWFSFPKNHPGYNWDKKKWRGRRLGLYNG